MGNGQRRRPGGASQVGSVYGNQTGATPGKLSRSQKRYGSVQRKEDGGYGAGAVRSSAGGEAGALTKECMTLLELVFASRTSAVKVVDDEIRLKEPLPPLTTTTANIVLECAVYALKVATGPIGAGITTALHDVVMRGGNLHRDPAPWIEKGKQRAPDKSPTIASLIANPVGRLVTAGVDQIVDAMREPATSDDGGSSYGQISEQGKRENVGAEPVSRNPKAAFFHVQRMALATAKSRITPELQAILARAVSQGGNVDELVPALRQLRANLKAAFDLAAKVQADATMAQWFSFRAQMRNGSDDSGGRSAANLEKQSLWGQSALGRSLVYIEVKLDPTKPQRPPQVVRAQVDGLEHADARNRFLDMDLMQSGAPVQVSSPSTGVQVTRNAAGKVWSHDAFSILYRKGKWRVRDDFSESDRSSNEFTEAAKAEGARILIEDEVLSKTLAEHGVSISGKLSIK